MRISSPWLRRNVPLLAVAAALLCGASAHAADAWDSVVVGHSLPLTVFGPNGTTGDKPLPVIVYLKNLAAPRTGTEGDETILRDFRAAGYLVAVLDFGHDSKERVPFLNRDLGKLRDDLRAKKLLSSWKIDDSHIFLVPEGCRLERDVVFYRDPARTLAMDIVYPSKPKKPVGSVLEFSCDNKDRMGNTSLSICSDTLLDAEATEGFAVAMADHPVPPPYKGLDPMPDSAWKIKAAVRTLRSRSKALNLSGKIVPVGFSRGSGMGLMLVTTAGQSEFEGHGENPGVRSSVEGAVVLSGRFTYMDLLPDDHMVPRYVAAWGERATHEQDWKRMGALDYLNHATVPLFLSINVSESPDALHQMDVLRKRLADLKSDSIYMLDPEPRGHKVPLVPRILGAMNDYIKSRLR